MFIVHRNTDRGRFKDILNATGKWIQPEKENNSFSIQKGILNDE